MRSIRSAVVSLGWVVGVAFGQTWTESQILGPATAVPIARYGFTLAVDDGWVAFASGPIDDRLFFARKVGPGEWVETQAVSIASLTTPRQLAMSGPVTVVADESNDNTFDSFGRAVIFERGDDDVWSQSVVLQPDDLVPGSRFGQFVAASGDRVAVVAPASFLSDNSEAIYVFRREASGTWVQEDRVELFDGSQGGFFPLGLAMDGDAMVLFEGEGFKGQCAFRFSAFERDAQNRWNLRSRIIEEAPCQQISVAMHGGVAVVGDSALEGPSGMFTGGARVYRRQPSGSWIRGEDLIPADAGPNSFVGGSIDFDGRTIIAGSQFALPNSFFAFELQPDGTFADLGPQTSLTIPDNANVGFGQSIGVDGNDAVIGVPSANNLDGFDSGLLAFFEREGPADTDGDGLPDDWEMNGVPFVALDGSARRYLIPGANPLRRDMYIEVDAAQIEMPASAMDQVVAAFARAPGVNPDGTEGITLHILIDEQGIDTPDSVVVGDAYPNNFDSLRNAHFGTPDERKDPDAPSLLAAKARVFRWCFAYSGIQFSADPGTVKYFGRGLIPSQSFVIDLDNDLFDVVLHPVTGPQDIASTFMHEYGHTLGLRHGGSDDIHGKPNYPSIMNYALAHTYPWNRSFRQLDFSREELLPLNESALDESRGINSEKYRRYRMPFGVGTDLNRRFSFVRLTGRATDFNANGVRQGIVQQDLNFMPAIDFAGVGFPSPGQPLPGYNDWANIQYLPPTGRGGESPNGCMNATVYEFMSTQVPELCEPDFNDDGLINFFDLRDYLLAYNAGDLEADLAEPFDTLNFFDIARFVQSFSAGCP